MSERLFGASVRRREDARLVTGRGRYVADVALPGVLHVALHRSPHAHARILAVDATEARRRPGVVHVAVPADVKALGRLPLQVPHPSLSPAACPEILPQQTVSYAGQPVAVVLAESAAQAVDALDALRIDYEPLPAAVTLDDALRADGPRVHATGPHDNVASRFVQRVGDVDAGLVRADVVLRERFHLHRGAGMAMEARAVAARWDADAGQSTVWSTTQAPQIVRRFVSRFLDLPEHAVRVITQDIGGGFGPKAIVYAEDILVPWLARAIGRPVRFIETKTEHLLAVTQERDQHHRGKGHTMKLVLFETRPQPTVVPGILTDRGVVNIADLVPIGHTPPTPIADVRLRAPLPRPGKILACIANYWEHGAMEARPLNMFLESGDAVIGPGDTIVLPEFTEPRIFRHEAELALVIRGPAKNVEQAHPDAVQRNRPKPAS